MHNLQQIEWEIERNKAVGRKMWHIENSGGLRAEKESKPTRVPISQERIGVLGASDKQQAHNN